ncbi:DUF2691 family protein [Herbivorax sp. ANBcel31]|uniref:DUF2691 family protein n=1 Tax=Herbivorax sp. ANBcel31 TaxID=3069754 RepID=UPI0027B21C61|nr:DUF2691 family protein [Herbivorax sp. ANBcel31]MDQ2085735.1 DUF2691 family protein [Herbivorax sp. ANBcel31]
MQKRGIRFQAPLHKLIQLQDVLGAIEIEKFNWHLNNIEIHESNIKINNDVWDIEQPLVIDGYNLKCKFECVKHLAIFGEFIAFLPDDVPCEINTYNEFLKSKAEIVFLVVDSSYYDIYCKDICLIEKIYVFAQSYGFKEIEYIDENDPRYKLSVW